MDFLMDCGLDQTEPPRQRIVSLRSACCAILNIGFLSCIGRWSEKG
jgi:hypothetical protein